MSHIPVPANQVLSCPFGGNPKVAAQMGIPSCGIARPGPFFANLNRPQGGGKRRKTRRRRGGNTDPAAEPALDNESGLEPTSAVPENPAAVSCPTGCVPKKKSRFGLGFFGLGGRRSRRGGRKSRRGGNCASHKKNEYGGRKSRRGRSYKKRKSRRVKSRKHHKKPKGRRGGNDPPGTPPTPSTVQYTPPSPQPQYPSTSASYGLGDIDQYGSNF